MRLVRWIACLPLAALASIIAGAVATVVTEFLGGSGWYAWMMSGTVSGVAFGWTAFTIAPAPSNALRWAVVALLGIAGLMAAAGPVMVGREPVRAFAGIAMVVIAVLLARTPRAQLPGVVPAEA